MKLKGHPQATQQRQQHSQQTQLGMALTGMSLLTGSGVKMGYVPDMGQMLPDGQVTGRNCGGPVFWRLTRAFSGCVPGVDA